MEQRYEPLPKTQAEKNHIDVCREINRQVPEWLNHKGEPCSCNKGTATIRECDLGSDGFAWMKECLKCHTRWVNSIEG